MAFLRKKNNSKSMLDMAGGLSSGVNSLVVRDGSKFPDTGDFMLTIWSRTAYPDPGDDPHMEIVRASARIGNVITIERGQEDTTDRDHDNASEVELLLTALGLNEMSDQNLKTTDSPSFDYVWALGGIRTTNINSWVEYDNLSDLTLQAAIFYDVVIEGGGGYTGGDGGGVRISGGDGGYFGGTGGDVTIAVGVPRGGSWSTPGAGEIIFKGNFNWKNVPEINYAGIINIIGSSGGVPPDPDPEYVVDGGFDTDDPVWYREGVYPDYISGWTIADGVATCRNNGGLGYAGILEQDIGQ